MDDVADLLRQLTATVDYLRVQVGEGAGEGAGEDQARHWLACDRIVGDGEALLSLVRSTKEGRGTDRDDVAMSLFVQGYAFRIASVAIGSWFLGDEVVDVSPERTAVALGRHRPNAVRLDDARPVEGGHALAVVHEHLVDDHLARLVATAHGACRVGEALLWGNVAAACASSFGAFMAPLPDRRGEIRDRADAFFATARRELAASGDLVHLGPVWAWERKACCLWYRTDSGFRCEDCSLWTPEERQDRYDRVLAEVDG